MKKAGIIVGLFIIVVATLICVIAFRNTDEVEQVPNQNSQQNYEVENNTEVLNNQEQIEEQPIQQQPIVQETVVEKIVTKEVSGVKTISEGSLGEPVSEKEVIVYIANKRILLVDENTESTNPKMLTYCFDVLTPENESLILFVTNSVYTQYNVNDKLMVKYQMYQNDKGLKFPLVLNVSAVN